MQMYSQRLAAGKYARKNVSRKATQNGERVEIDYYKEALSTYATALKQAYGIEPFSIQAAKSLIFIADAMMEAMKLEGEVYIDGTSANAIGDALRLFRDAREISEMAAVPSFYLYCRAKELHALSESGLSEEAKRQFHRLALLSDSRYGSRNACLL